MVFDSRLIAYYIELAVSIHDDESCMRLYSGISVNYPDWLKDNPEMNYLFGRTLYEFVAPDQAIIHFLNAIKFEPIDELSHFYAGNCFLRLGKTSEAQKHFELALFINKSFAEARNNLEGKKIDWNVSSSLNFDIEDPEACLDIPIFINNRDRVDCLEKLLDWLLDAGYRRIYILDQDSTYPPLFKFYQQIQNDSRVEIIRQGNLGHKALWISKILDDLDIQTPYVYTDSDLIPTDSTPKNLVQLLLQTLKKNPFTKKVGVKLRFEDLPQKPELKSIIEMQSGYYSKDRKISEFEFASPVDTTFAVYRNVRHYNLSYSVIRSDVEFLHMPWYYDSKNLPPDEKYYVEHANQSSTFASSLKSNN